MGIPAGMGVAAAGTPNSGDQANAVASGQITAIGPRAPFAFRGPMNLVIWASINQTLTTTAASLAASVGSITGITKGASINSTLVPAGATVEGISGNNFNITLPPITLPVYPTKASPGVPFDPGISTQSFNVRLPPGSNVAALLGATVTVPSTAMGVTMPAATTVTAIVQADIAPTTENRGNSPGRPGIIQLSAKPTAVPNAPGTPQVVIQLQFAPTGNAIAASGSDTAATFTGGLTSITFSASVALERSFDGGLTWVPCNIPTNSATVIPAIWTAGPVSLTFGEPEKNVLYRLNALDYASGTINYRVSQTGGAAESLAIGPLSGG
jgi:hypothetical protein